MAITAEQAMLSLWTSEESFARERFNMFYNPTPMDVTIKDMPKPDGTVGDITLPNMAKQKKSFDNWKDTVRVKNLPVDYTFRKIIPSGVSLKGETLWNPRDLDAQTKDSFIILFDGAHNSDKKYDDGYIDRGVYLGQINFSSASVGGGVYSAVIGFLYTHYGHTNNNLLEELPITRNAHAFNGAEVKVYTRSLSTGNSYTQHNQILFLLDENESTLTKDITIELKLKRMI